MNVLLLASHAIAEYDDVRMFHHLGYDIFAPGGYERPGAPGEGLRPALPEVPEHPELVEACNAQRAEYGDPGWRIDWAKAMLHDTVLDWADVIIVHHFPERWIGGQWSRIKHKRVIWRTCGQSNPDLERTMAEYHGLQIVRYSPNEERAFGSDFAGQDALIRFGKFPDDYGPWAGDLPVVGNITQWRGSDDPPLARGNAVGLDTYLATTAGLPAMPAGQGSEDLPGGVGKLEYEIMLRYLCHIRTYLYMGTIPAPYTLGLIEAMLSGVPVLAHSLLTPFDAQWIGALSEAKAILGQERMTGHIIPTNLRIFLEDRDYAATIGEEGRQRAVDLFGMDTIGPQWQAFLG